MDTKRWVQFGVATGICAVLAVGVGMWWADRTTAPEGDNAPLTAEEVEQVRADDLAQRWAETTIEWPDTPVDLPDETHYPTWTLTAAVNDLDEVDTYALLRTTHAGNPDRDITGRAATSNLGDTALQHTNGNVIATWEPSESHDPATATTARVDVARDSAFSAATQLYATIGLDLADLTETVGPRVNGDGTVTFTFAPNLPTSNDIPSPPALPLQSRLDVDLGSSSVIGFSVPTRTVHDSTDTPRADVDDPQDIVTDGNIGLGSTPNPPDTITFTTPHVFLVETDGTLQWALRYHANTTELWLPVTQGN